MTTVAIIQARTGSSRLPGKVLLPLLGEPLLTRVVRRVGRADRLDKVVVATTTQPADDAIVSLAEREGWPVERGSETDLLNRYVQAARRHRADVVVRITSDCPLIDPRLIDDTVAGRTGPMRLREQLARAPHVPKGFGRRGRGGGGPGARMAGGPGSRVP